MRVRSFTQDDAHIFCEEEQINQETIAFCKLLQEVYRDFGFTEVLVKFSTRPEKRAGSDEVWDKAENALAKAVELAGLDYELNPGEGAFYGPKLEFTLVDALKRHWQCGTLQVVVLAITSSALWIASRLEIPALHLHPPAVSAALHMSGRDARTPAGHIHASEIPSQRRATEIPPPPLTIHIHPLIHTYIHGFSPASFAIPFLAIDLLIALKLAYMV
jgi:hypothetical protein